MEASTIQEYLSRLPFAPFRLMLSNQKIIEVANPGLVVVMKREVFIADPSGDRFRLVWLMHVVQVESQSAA